MAVDPSFPFYAQDYIVKSLRWNDSMKALYNDLRAEIWINGALQDENGAPFGLTQAQRQTFPLIAKEFALTDNGWINIELEEARQKRLAFKQLQSAKGKKGGRPGKPEQSPGKAGAFDEENPGESRVLTEDKAEHITELNPTESLLENENENENVEENIEGVQGEQKNRSGFLLPVPAMREVWKKHKPKYIFRNGVDEAPLRIICEMVGKASGVNPFEYSGLQTVVETWDAIVTFIVTDKLYKDFQLTQVEKYFQAITAKMESVINEPAKPDAVKKKGSIIQENIAAAATARDLVKKKYENKTTA